ncbi:MAG TPA: lipopolysaccharide transport periplasmic protein LptA [Pseudomonadales bacterium]|nr:lipopolysaccharide transport periplasmic protein LptA [Pseudomonadales bacterium]
MKSPSTHNLLVVIAVTTVWGSCATPVQALPEDRNQPIEIQANSADRSSKTGVTTYSGHVEIKQGSIRITANSVVLNSEQDELTHLTATGNPATYTQQLTGSADTVDAKANQITFDVHTDTVVLNGNGTLKQKGGSISGEHIEYDIKSEHVKALAAENGSADNNKRITVVIPPSKRPAPTPETPNP